MAAVRTSCRGCGDGAFGVLGCRTQPSHSSVRQYRPRWSSRLRVAVCLTMALLVQCLDSFCCCAELLSHRRGHVDPEYYDPGRHEFSIETRTDAVKYLKKYGYLNCTIPKPMRRQPQLLTEGRRKRIDFSISEGYVCTVSDIRKALLVLQTNFHIRKTGTLDDRTMTTMSQRRCGNSDAIKTTQTAPGRVDLVDLYARLPNNSVGGRQGQRRRRSSRFVQRSYEGGRRSYEGGRRTYEGGRRSYKGGRRSRRSVPLTEGLVVPTSEGGVMRGPYDLDPVEYVETNALESRKRMLEEIRNRLNATQTETKGSSLIERIPAKRYSRLKVMRGIRRKRLSKSAGSIVDEVNKEGRHRLNRDENNPIRWMLLSDEISRKIPLISQKATLNLAFRMWSEVSPLRFVEHNEDDLHNNIDIMIAFGKESHMNCAKRFDGPGGELAHTLSDGSIHFDDDEDYHDNGRGISLLKVAVHEVGHVLGLAHNNRRYSVMYPIYDSAPNHEDFELVHEDRLAIQSIYGVCKGTFDTVFDWVRQHRDRETGQPKYIYNTYFFRRNYYWMYENSQNRTRYGDPLLIEKGWTDLSSDIDGYVQTVLNAESSFEIETYFFKGDMYYKYNDLEDKVMDGYPRRIAEDFGPRPDSNISLPNVVDAVWFDETITDKPTLYFFKGEWVWLYDAREIGRNACCDAKRRFTELFPMIEPLSSDPLDILTGDIDSVYYSFASRQTYFFKGELVYSLVLNHDGSKPGQLGLRKLSPWYNIWHDICEVD